MLCEVNGKRIIENINDANIKYIIRLFLSSILCLLTNLLKTNDSAKNVAAKKDNNIYDILIFYTNTV